MEAQCRIFPLENFSELTKTFQFARANDAVAFIGYASKQIFLAAWGIKSIVGTAIVSIWA